jgi:hypothetical protein
MAKHNGITIRLGALHDEVNVTSDGGTVTFDRSEMRKGGKHKDQGTLRREVVSAWSDAKERRERDKRRSQSRKTIRQMKHADRFADAELA